MISQTLIVYVQGLVETPSLAKPLLQELCGELDDTSSIWVYPDTVRPWSRRKMESHAERLCEDIGDYWRSHSRPRKIVLVGHSIGAVLVRYAFLLALGELDGRHREWVNNVVRIVLLSSPSRGFDFSRFPKLQGHLFNSLAWVFPGFAVFQVRAGSPFITNLRLTWIRQIPQLGDRAPIIVQVRGQNDDLVSREDGRDVEILPTGVDFLVPSAKHGDLPRIPDAHDETVPGQRLSKLKEAILGEGLSPQNAPELPESERDYQSIVFVLHGIRAGNDTWVADLERQLSEDRSVGVVTASYGRFSAYNFALPVTRRRTLRWFQDQYSFYLAKHPDKPFHFVGHSNGTYLLGQSLRKLRAMRFDRVFLAGSVLPRKFDWRGYAAKGRIGSLVNVCASKDKPVAWLCSMLNGLGMHDIGVGGFAGFDLLPIGAVQLRHIPGGHSDALTSERLPAIANYIRNGQFDEYTDLEHPLAWFSTISRAAPYVARFVALSIIGIVIYSVIVGPLLFLIIAAVALGLIYLVLKIA
jgi:pimeloyl-ACP methyl ester carboxylesterase